MTRIAHIISRGPSLRFAALFCALSATASAQLTFNFVPSSAISSEALTGFQVAGARWSSLFSDNMQVNLSIDFSPLAPGVLGSTSTPLLSGTYSSLRSALVADATSQDDATAIANLITGSSVPMVLNYTSNNPNGAGSPLPYLDNNNSANNRSIIATRANLKALGLISPFSTTIDATIRFSSLFNWDFNPDDGITAGTSDFIGVAAHEIGHALGFISGVDALDTNSPRSDGTFPTEDQLRLSVLDLYRYSSTSALFGIPDFSADSRAKYFSIDGGDTLVARFATGRVHGDGRQASHWRNNTGGTTSLGLMDPALASGELALITELDLRAFDVIGYNRILAVPEPATYGALAAGGLLALVALRRQRRRA